MSGPTITTAIRRGAGLHLGFGLATVMLCGAAGLALAATPISYPPSRAVKDVGAWLQRDTPLALSQVVDISPQAVTAVTGAQPMGERRGFLANISSEAMDPEILAHDGIVSWSIPVEIDCEGRLARLGVMTGYHSRDLKTDPRVVRNADINWSQPLTSSPLGSVIGALCDRDFQRPFVGAPKMAAKDAEPAKSASRKGAKPGPLPQIVATPKPAPEAPPVPTNRPELDAQTPSAPPSSAPQASTPPPLQPAAQPARPSGPAPAVITIRPSSAAPEGAASAVTSAPVRTKPKPPAGGGAFALQIGASPSLPDAQGLLTRFRKKFGADLGGLVTGVTPAQVDGKTVNRVLLSGFSSFKEANAFCKTLTAGGQACFVRP